jgi:hypothetical protein
VIHAMNTSQLQVLEVVVNNLSRIIWNSILNGCWPGTIFWHLLVIKKRSPL